MNPPASESAVASSVSADAPPTPDATPRRKGRIVDSEAFQLAPELLNTPLAAPWQRAGAMAVDLVALGALSLLTGPVLGCLTGLTLASLGSRRVSSSRFWLGFRWVLILIGAIVMILSGFLMIGQPLVRTSAFNLGRAESATEMSEILVPPSAGSSELRRAVDQLQRQTRLLREDNERLRDSARGSSWLNATTDFSRTLGLTFGWAGVYFTLSTAWLRGRTPGKLLFRTRVVRLDGKPLTAMDAFTRNGGYAAGLATGSIGFLRLLWDPNRQAIQDKIAGTVVVSMRVEKSPAAPPVSTAT